MHGRNWTLALSVLVLAASLLSMPYALAAPQQSTEASPSLKAALEELLELQLGMRLKDLLEARPGIEYGGMDDPSGVRPEKDPERPNLSLIENIKDSEALRPWVGLLVMYEVRDHRLAAATILLAAEGAFDAAKVRDSVAALRQVLGPEDSYVTLQTRHEAGKPLSAPTHMLLWKREAGEVRLTSPDPKFAGAQADRVGGAAVSIQITAKPLSELVGLHGIVHEGKEETRAVMQSLGIPLPLEGGAEQETKTGG